MYLLLSFPPGKDPNNGSTLADSNVMGFALFANKVVRTHTKQTPVQGKKIVEIASLYVEKELELEEQLIYTLAFNVVGE